MTAPTTTWTPSKRYRHDADRLESLAEWLQVSVTQNRHPDAPTVALDYYRLADQLQQMAEDARTFARLYATN